MRGAIVGVCLASIGLAACAGGNAANTTTPGTVNWGAAPAAQNGPPDASYPNANIAAPAAAEAPVAEKPAPAPKRGTRAARAASAPPAPAAPAAESKPDHELSDQEKVIQARTDCWMGVERAKGVGRNIDARMAWVEKCIAEKKSKP